LYEYTGNIIAMTDNNQLSEVFYCRNSVAVWQQV
jgi:hypothetical protein